MMFGADKRIISFVRSFFIFFFALPAFSNPYFFNSESLLKLIREKNAATLVDVAGSLPVEFRKNSTWIENSESAQGTSKNYPRLLAWSDSGFFAMTFNGDPKQIGFNSIEMWQFKDGQFHFSRIQFPLKKDPSGKVLVDVEFPEHCLACHGDNPRPNWKEYPRWEGVYGALDDFMTDEQWASFNEFRKVQKENPLYSPFFFADERPEFPYRENMNKGLQNLSLSFTYRPNQRFGDFANRLNAKRLTAMVLSVHTDQKDRFADLASILHCEKAEPLETRLSKMKLQPNDVDMREPYYVTDGFDVEMSYFDGAATTRELWAADLAKKLGLPDVSRSYADKYTADTEVVKMDRPFLDQMDSITHWISIPYKPSTTTAFQKREPFRGAFGSKWKGMCEGLNR